MLDDLLADTNSGHNIVATVFVQCRSMHRAGGPEEMKPVGETEFVNGVAAMSASGGYGKTKICAGIVGPRRSAAWVRGCERCWRRISAPAADGSAASATSPPGTPIRR